MGSQADLERARASYARLAAAASGSADPRLERAFAQVPREAFLPPGPWQVLVDQQRVRTVDADPVHLYRNVLVAIDSTRGINNGEPHLHAAWMGAVAPAAGDRICHIGAGTGYYTAILSLLASPGGRVEAFEIETALAAQARRNLAPYENVTVTTGDATRLPTPLSDLIYVNAGVAAPPLRWLQALPVGGRMIFPWRPSYRIGLAVLLTRLERGFRASAPMSSWFIPATGASSTKDCTMMPGARQARRIRSAWLASERPPDDTAAAIYPHVWFSVAEAG